MLANKLKGKTMKEYHKIQTLFKRDMKNAGKTLLEGQMDAAGI